MVDFALFRVGQSDNHPEVFCHVLILQQRTKLRWVVEKLHQVHFDCLLDIAFGYWNVNGWRDVRKALRSDVKCSVSMAVDPIREAVLYCCHGGREEVNSEVVKEKPSKDRTGYVVQESLTSRASRKVPLSVRTTPRPSTHSVATRGFVATEVRV